jgi:enoyl-CoA hydratase/carnithine racemase
MTPTYPIRLPERFDVPALRALREAVSGIPGDGTVTVVGASEEVFCLGLGIASLGALSSSEREAGFSDFRTALLGLVRSPAPTVAAIRGQALGGGLGVAAACDVVVASEDATFGLPEPLFGLVPGLIMPVLRTRMSAGALRRLCIQGGSFDAREACAVGVVDEVVPVDEVDRAVAKWTRLLARADRGAVGRLKSWLADMDDLDARVDEGRALLDELMGTSEFRRRVGRFEKGLAPWEADDEAP